MMPRLKICQQCQRHGHIITSTGVLGPEVYSKPFAKAMVETGIDYNEIKQEERKGLYQEIDWSVLPSTDEEVEQLVRKAVINWNSIDLSDSNYQQNGGDQCVVKYYQRSYYPQSDTLDEFRKSHAQSGLA
jgi:hypothetical protein